MYDVNTTLAVTWNSEATRFEDLYALEGRFITGETTIIAAGPDVSHMLGVAERVKKGWCPGDLSVKLYENKVSASDMATALVICEVDELFMPLGLDGDE